MTRTMERTMSREEAEELIEGIQCCQKYSPYSSNIAIWGQQLILAGWDVKDVPANTECGYLTELSEELLIEDGEEDEETNDEDE